MSPPIPGLADLDGVWTNREATTTRGNRPGENKARLLLATFRDRHQWDQGKAQKEGYTFDAGPPVITDPACLRELWSLTGSSMALDVELLPVQPFYRLNWMDGTNFDYSNDDQALYREIAKLDPVVNLFFWMSGMAAVSAAAKAGVSIGGYGEALYQNFSRTDQSGEPSHPTGRGNGIAGTADEPDETFFVNLTNPVNTSLNSTQATGTIVSDTGEPFDFRSQQLQVAARPATPPRSRPGPAGRRQPERRDDRTQHSARDHWTRRIASRSGPCCSATRQGRGLRGGAGPSGTGRSSP